MALSDVVEVLVNINQSTVAQQGFGTPLIFGHHAGAERVMTFKGASWKSDLLAALAVGAVTEDAARRTSVYRLASAMMAQNPRPSTLKVGRRTSSETQVVRLIPQDVSGSAILRFSVTIEGPDGIAETATFDSDASPTMAEVCTGLATEINDLNALVTADGTSGTHVVVTANTPDEIFSFHTLKGLILHDFTVAPTTPTVAADLDAIQAEDDDWYALALPSSAPAIIEAAADWVEPAEKIFIAQTHDYRPLTNATDDIVSSIKSQNYSRTHVAYSSRAGTFYGASWAAAMLPYEPGQADWKFKLVRGAVADKLSGTEESYLVSKYGSYYEPLIKGRDASGVAKGGDGVFIDLTQLKDWLTARTIEGIVRMLTSAPKVPFTDQGAGNSIWGVLRGVIEQGIDNGAIDEDPDTWSIYVPKRAELTAQDRTDRVWRGCSFDVVPTGAVHSVGVITINLNVDAG